MKYALLFLFPLNLIQAQNIWNSYIPVQSNVLGSTIVSYDEKSFQIALVRPNTEIQLDSAIGGENIKDTLITNLKKSFGVYKQKSLRISDVDIEGSTHIYKVANIGTIPPDVPFVYSAISADKIRLTLEFDSKQTLNYKELVDFTEDILSKKLKMDINLINTDSIISELKREGKTTIDINNKDVYYIVQFAKVKRKGKYGKWGRSWTNLRLFPLDIEKNTSYPLRINRWWWKRDPHKANAYLKAIIKNDLELEFSATYPGFRPILLQAKYLGDERVWEYTEEVIATYPVSDKKFKFLNLSIRAKANGTEFIDIPSARLSFPEGKLKILKKIK